MKISIGDKLVDIEVELFSDFPRGSDGLCALCHGDPCNDRSAPDSLIAQWWAENKSWASTCPVCDGRPS